MYICADSDSPCTDKHNIGVLMSFIALDITGWLPVGLQGKTNIVFYSYP